MCQRIVKGIVSIIAINYFFLPENQNNRIYYNFAKYNELMQLLPAKGSCYHNHYLSKYK